MSKNYLKIAIRIFWKQKVYSLINIAGLVIGLTCFILIFLYVHYEKSYDTFHDNADRIFRVAIHDPGNMERDQNSWASSSAALALTLMDEFPEVSAATRFRPSNRFLLTKEEKNFYENGLYADEHFFDVFSFPLVEGNQNRILENPNAMVITQRLAKKFFGNENPVGKTLSCAFGDLEVVGVVENIPENSHIQFDWLISFKRIKASIEANTNSQYFWWGASNYYTYLIMQNESSKDILEKKITASMNKKFRDFNWDHMKYKYFLQPIKSIHLKSHLRSEFSVNNSDKLIHFFSIIAILILAIAGINSMNLSSAYTVKRMKEIGIRKVVGGQRSQLLWQFTGESLFNFIFSLLAAVGLAYLLLPIFNRLVERNITFIENSFILCTLAVLFISALLAGLYPAMALSSFKTVDILKGKRRITGKGVIPKNLLVMFQFSITIILIISSLVVFLQIRYVQKKPLGYNREHVVLMRRADKGVTRNFHAFKNTLLKNPKVIGITTSDHPPTDVGNRWGGREYITDEGVTVKRFPSYLLWIDYNYLDFYDTEIIKGRNFSAAYGTDEENAVILNETFVQNLNWNDPIGKKIQVWNKQEKVVIGVVKDFHFQSMHNEIAPILIFCRPDNYYIQIRIQSDHMPETLKFLRKAYESYRIRYPFEYNFLDESYDQMYNSDRKLAQMLVSFSGLAIFIACLGIFGLASYATETRIKEIGIRKVLGASGPGIFMHLSRGFTKWVVVANIFAWPIAYLAMNKWLQNFAYRIDMSVWIFILAGLVALVIALVTVSYQAIKAAMANPVESLRYE